MLYESVWFSIRLHDLMYHDFIFNLHYIHIPLNTLGAPDWGLGRKVAAALATEVTCLSWAVLQTFMHPFPFFHQGKRGPWVGPRRGPGCEKEKYTHVYKAMWIFADVHGFLRMLMSLHDCRMIWHDLSCLAMILDMMIPNENKMMFVFPTLWDLGPRKMTSSKAQPMA